MPSIVITNISSGTLSIDIPAPGGAFGEGHAKAIRARLGRGESIDVASYISIDDLNRTSEFKSLLRSGVITVTANAESDDVDIPISAAGAGGWVDAGVRVQLGDATDTVAIGASAMVGAEKVLITHTGTTAARFQSTVAGAAGLLLEFAHAKAGAGAGGDVLCQFDYIGKDDAPLPSTYAQQILSIVSAAAGDEDALMYWNLMQDGTLASVFSFWKGGSVMQGRDDTTPTLGPTVGTFFDKASGLGADNDIIARYAMSGYDTVGGSAEFVRINGLASSAAAGAEYGQINIHLIANGVMPTVPQLTLSNTGMGHRGLLSATEGPELATTFSKGAAGANNDIAGYLGAYANNDASALKEILYWTWDVPDAAAATCTGRAKLNILDDNVDTQVLQIDSCDTNDDTCLMIRLNDAGAKALRRVSIGADDSGGVGFKQLLVPN